MEMGAHEDAHLQARSINRCESRVWGEIDSEMPSIEKLRHFAAIRHGWYASPLPVLLSPDQTSTIQMGETTARSIGDAA